MRFKFPIFLAMVLLPLWAAAEPAKVAVVAHAALEGAPLAALIPAALAASDGVQTIERAALGAVIDEAALVRLAGDDRAARLEILRRMQVADALVVLRPVDLAGKPGTAVIVCEMQRGLRLLHRSLPADAGETGAALIAEEIVAHLAAARRPDVQIWAVPPPINRNLSYRYDHLQAAYAALVTRHLSQAPKVLLVELSEARSLAQEQALGGDEVRRDQPWYVMGEFRHDGDDARVALTLELEHGGRRIATWSRPSDADEPVAAFIERAATAMLAKADASPPQAVALEADILLDRARKLAAIADFAAAANLYESAFLLDPGNAAAWREAALVTARLRGRAAALHDRLAFHRGPADEVRDAMFQALALHRRAVEQWEQWYRRRAQATPQDYDDYAIFEYGFRILADAARSKDEAIRQRVTEVQRVQRDIYYDCLAFDLRQGRIVDPRDAAGHARASRLTTLWQPDGEARGREGVERLCVFAASLEDTPMAVKVVWHIIEGLRGPAVWYDADGRAAFEHSDAVQSETMQLLASRGGAVGRKVADRYREKAEENRRRIAEAAKNPSPHRGPGPAVEARSGTVTASLRPIPLDLDAKLIRDWQPLNESADLILTRRGEFRLVDRHGATRELPLGSGHYLPGIWGFDGTYLWVLERDRGNAAGRLHVYDLASGVVSSVELADYELAVRQGGIVAPISPGRVIVVAAFKDVEDGSDRDVRTWYADIRIDTARPLGPRTLVEAGIKPFHQATEAFDPYGGRGLANPRQGHVPKEVAVVRQANQPGEAYLLINGRVLLDTADHSFHMVKEIADRRSRYVVVGDSVYFLRSDGKMYQGGYTELIRRRLPAMQPEVVDPKVPYDFDSGRYPWYVSAGWHVMVSSNVAYCTPDLQTPFARLETGKPLEASRIFPSGLWGYVLIHDGQAHALERLRRITRE